MQTARIEEGVQKRVRPSGIGAVAGAVRYRITPLCASHEKSLGRRPVALRFDQTPRVRNGQPPAGRAKPQLAAKASAASSMSVISPQPPLFK